MTIETDNEVSITIEFDEAVQAIAFLSDFMDWLVLTNVDAKLQHMKCLNTAKEICEAFVCEHFQKELEDTP